MGPSRVPELSPLLQLQSMEAPRFLMDSALQDPHQHLSTPEPIGDVVPPGSVLLAGLQVHGTSFGVPARGFALALGSPLSGQELRLCVPAA